MHMLDRMRYVWPAAWRANELLHGVKVLPQQQQSTLMKISTPERHKRVVDSLDDNVEGTISTDVYRASQSYAEGSSAQAQSSFPLQLDIPPSEPQGFYPSYSRWNADNSLPALAGSLSTSVLPQQYSTGLVDERVQRTQDRSSRYPQYWSDYSAMGQMDTAYGMAVMGDMVTQPSSQTDPQMYVQDQYSLYSE
jgi:hypothetical protein